jgi:hypothetical protein
VSEVTSAYAELASKIVGCRNTRKDLDGTQGIVGEDAPEILNVGAPEDLLRRDARIGAPESIGRDRHRLGVSAGPFAQWDRDVDAGTRGNLHVASDQDVSDNGDIELMRSWRNRRQSERASRVRLGGRAAVLNQYQNFVDSNRRPGVDDMARNAPRLLCVNRS